MEEHLLQGYSKSTTVAQSTRVGSSTVTVALLSSVIPRTKGCTTRANLKHWVWVVQNVIQVKPLIRLGSVPPPHAQAPHRRVRTPASEVALARRRLDLPRAQLLPTGRLSSASSAAKSKGCGVLYSSVSRRRGYSVWAATSLQCRRLVLGRVRRSHGAVRRRGGGTRCARPSRRPFRQARPCDRGSGTHWDSPGARGVKVASPLLICPVVMERSCTDLQPPPATQGKRSQSGLILGDTQ